MKLRHIIVFLFVLIFAATAFAQDETEEPRDCTEIYETVETFIEENIDGLVDADDPNLQLLLIQAIVETARTQCNGFVFTDEDFGLDTVTDPIIFNGGTYRMILESEGNASVDVTAIEGRCTGFIYTTSDNHKAEDVFQVRDESCVVLLEIDARQAYTLTFSPITR